MVIVEPVRAVVLRAELGAGDILQPDHAPVRERLDDDALILLGGGQLPRGVHRVLERRVRTLDGRRPECAPGRHDVLRLDRVRNVRRRQAERRERVRPEPRADRVVLFGEHEAVADPRDPQQRVEDVQEHVIAEKDRVVAVVRRVHGEDHEKVRRRLPHGNAEVVDGGRQVGGRLAHAVLDCDRVEVRVGAERERGGQGILARRRALRLHVQHVRNAIDRFFDWDGDVLRHHLRVGPDVGRRDRDGGRADVGILFPRKRRV